jgi:hypothetical protein
VRRTAPPRPAREARHRLPDLPVRQLSERLTEIGMCMPMNLDLSLAPDSTQVRLQSVGPARGRPSQYSYAHKHS